MEHSIDVTASLRDAFLNGVPHAKRKPDNGHTLSMHQPWASLFATGVKRVEGRSWRSDFTSGWLWVHAASAVPDPSVVAEVEASYAGAQLPAAYPLSCLLGRVYVVGQLSHEEYAQMGYSEQNDSEFVFLSAADSWQTLTLPLAMSGDHKIWRLSKAVHATCKKAIEASHNN
jgi:hypothetical protein